MLFKIAVIKIMIFFFFNNAIHWYDIGFVPSIYLFCLIYKIE